MLFATQLVGFGAGGEPKILTYIGETSATNNATVYTFTGASIGTAASDRRVIVAVMGGGSNSGVTLSSVTVGGVTATINGQATNGNSVGAIVTAAVPTGTTGDIVVTFSGQKERCNVGVWSATGLTSNAAIDFDSGTADPGTATLDAVIGGFCIALAVSSNTTTLTWTNVTENYDVQPESADTASGASAATTAVTIAPSGNYASGSGSLVAVFATF